MINIVVFIKGKDYIIQYEQIFSNWELIEEIVIEQN